jgi:hypothetical protein
MSFCDVGIETFLRTSQCAELARLARHVVAKNFINLNASRID